MFGNYLVTALRAFKTQKQHFILNLLGLSVGLAAAVMVALFAKNELSYDSQHPDAENIYRIAQDYRKIGLSVIPIFNYARGLQALELNQVDDIFALTMLSHDSSSEVATDVQYRGQGYKLEGLYSASANIHDFMSISTLYGDLAQALSTPGGIALNQSEAQRIFGKLNVVGETLNHANGNYTVYAVFADLPENTHFAFKSLAYQKQDLNNFDMQNHYVYLKLVDGADISVIEQHLTERNYTGEFKGLLRVELHPLLDLHLNAKSPFEMKAGGTKQAVNICLGLSVLLVLVAAFNFINMSIAQSTKRAKEVGVRKALGASKSQLVTQFLSESVMVSLLAMLIASCIVELTLPSFNMLVDRELTFNYASSYSVILVVVALTVGLVSGLYPALFICAFSAKRVLSGDLQRGSTAIFVRKSLLTLQASLSIALIIASVTLQQQLAHLQSLPLGFSKAHQLVVSQLPIDLVLSKQPSALVNKLQAIDGVKGVTIVDTKLTSSINASVKPTWPNGETTEGVVPFVGTGFGIVDGLGLQLLAGRDFSESYASDWVSREEGLAHMGAIVTESVVRQAGFEDNAQIIGKVISDQGRGMRMKVVGVVADVKIGNMKEEYSNIFFLCGMTLVPTADVILKVEQQNLPYIKSQLGHILALDHGVYEPQIELLTESFSALLKGDQRVSDVVLLFSSLAIFLTILGTFGLASFSALRRQKEVAMRKVLGASRFSLINLLAKEFLWLVGLSVIIAYPLTYWFLEQWLSNFNDRVVQSWWIYAVAALVVAGITWLTVASLAYKTASTRPSLILRYE